jgi:proton-coupled amino acid transporter
MEHGLFTQSGKEDFRVKWMKNIFRALLVCVCAIISWVGAADLDKFAAFVGCFTAFVMLLLLHISLNV